MRGWTRDLWGEEHEAPTEQINAATWTVEVFGLGYVLFIRRPTGEWGAVFTKGNEADDARAGQPSERTVKVREGHVECEVLPGEHDGDRIVACLSL